MADPNAPHRRPRSRVAAASWIGKPFRLRPNTRIDGTPASPRISPRRALRLISGGVIGVVAALALVWLAILYLPLPASQIVPRVQEALQSRLGPDYAVTIADAELHRGGDGVELRLVDLAISKTGGPVIAEAPRVELRVDGMSLLRGEVTVRSVHVTRPRLDMQFDTTLGAASVQADLPRRILDGVADLDRLLGPDGAAGALEEVEVDGATLLVAPRSRAPLALDGVDLRLSRTAGGALALTASSARSGDRWTTAVTVSPAPDGQGRVIDLGLENVDLAPYSAPLAEKAGAPPLKGRVSGHLNARIGADGKLLAGSGRIRARGIEATLPGPPPAAGATPSSLYVETLQLNLGWDAAKRALMIEPSRVEGRGGQMTFSGALTAPNEGRAAWSALLEGRDVLLSAEHGGEPPLRLDRITVDAAFDAASGVLEIGRAQFRGPTAKAAATGLIRFEGASPAIRLGLVSEPMPASAMKRLWPFFMASEPRAWAIENVGAGTVDSLSLSLDIGSGVLASLGPRDTLPEGSMSLEVAFSNAVLRGKPGLPWIEGAGGRILASASRVTATIAQGFVAQEGGVVGALAVKDVRFEIADTRPAYQPALVTFKAEGPIDPALALLASGAIGANPLPPQLDASKVSGKIAADVSIGFELRQLSDPPAPDADVRVTADLSDVRIANVFANRSFENGAFKVVRAGGKTDVTGKGAVGGAPATVAVTETLATPTTQAKRELKATLTADAGDLTRLGLDVPGTLKGAVPLEATLLLDQPGAPIALSADLKAVGIDGLAPGFKKPAGQPGRLSFTVERSPDRTVVKNLALESGDRSVRGAIEFGPKGELISATLPIYRPGPGDDARVEIDKTRSGSVKVAVQGAALDLKPLLDAFRGKSVAARSAAPAGGAGAIPKNLDVVAKLGTGLGYGGEALSGLDLRIAMRDGKVTDADGSARVGRGVIKLATAEDGRLRLTGEDAGAFFRLADLYGRIDGGVFDLQASLVGGPGLLRVRDFSVRNDDALNRVRQTTGANRNTPAQAGSTRFDRLRVTFVEGRGKIDIQEATLTGPQLGATLQGQVDYSADRVSLVGTFVPVYALNNLVSRVPLIGALLGGGSNGGLLGVTFQVKGRTAAPTVTVNPLSAVAPGFLRKIFEFRQSGTDAPTGATGQRAAPEQTER